MGQTMGLGTGCFWNWLCTQGNAIFVEKYFESFIGINQND